jgi:hypothetical protein
MVDLSAFEGLEGNYQAGEPLWSALKTDDTHQCGSGCGHTSPLAGISLAEGFDLSAFNVIASRTAPVHQQEHIKTHQVNGIHQLSTLEILTRESLPNSKGTFGNEPAQVKNVEAGISATRPIPQTRAASQDVRPGNIPYSRTEGDSQRRENTYRTDTQYERPSRLSSPLPPSGTAKRAHSSPVAPLTNQGRPHVSNAPVERFFVSNTQATASRRQLESAPLPKTSSTRGRDEPSLQSQSPKVPPSLRSNQNYQSSGEPRTALGTSPKKTTLQANNSNVHTKSRGYVGWSSDRPSIPQPHANFSREIPSAQRLETAALPTPRGVNSSQPTRSQELLSSPSSTRNLPATPRNVDGLVSKPSTHRPLAPGSTPLESKKLQLSPRATPLTSKEGGIRTQQRQSGDQQAPGFSRKSVTTTLQVPKRGAVQPERTAARGETAITSHLRSHRALGVGLQHPQDIPKATTRPGRANTQSTKNRDSARERVTSASKRSRRLDIQRRAIIDRVNRVVGRVATSSKRQSVATRLAQIDLASRIFELLNDEDDLTLYEEREVRRVRYPIRGARNRRRKSLVQISNTERARREKRRREQRGEVQRAGMEISGSERLVAQTSHQATQRVSNAKNTGPSKSLDIFQAKSDDDADASTLKGDLAEKNPYQS